MIRGGVRIRLLVGAAIPLPAPPPVLDAIQTIEVKSRDEGGDGFQITFGISKERASDYALSASGLFEPPARLVVQVDVGGAPETLIDGVVLHHQLQASELPGRSIFTVMGKDTSALLDLEERQATYPNQGDSTVVTQLLARYARYGLVPQVTPTANVPLETQRIPTQRGTDLAFIRELAANNGFVFRVEPTAVPGTSTAYWGPEQRSGPPQPALTVGITPGANVEGALHFSFDALGPESLSGSVVDAASRSGIAIASLGPSTGALAARSFQPLRTSLLRDVGKLDAGAARQRANAEAERRRDPVAATGELDGLRYGSVLRARRLVAVRGAGTDYDGTYRVTEVSHALRRGEFRQRFTIVRDGRGSTSTTVMP